MSKSFRRSVLLLLSVILVFVVAACGNGKDEPTASDSATTAATTTATTAAPADNATVAPTDAPKADPVKYTLNIHYSTDDEKDPADWAIAEVKKQFPNVSFDVSPQLNDNGESLKARIATGDLPDIFLISPSHLDAAIQTGSILDLTAAWNASGAQSRMQQNAIDTQLKYKDGKIWAIQGAGAGINPLYYNKKVFADNGVKVPTNYPEFLAAVKAFNAKGIVTIPIFAKEAWPIGAFFDMFAMRANPKGMMALNDGDIKASDPAMADAINKMAEIIKAGVFQKGATSADYDTARSIFHTGKAAMLVNGEWDIADMVKDGMNMADVDFLDVYPTTDAGKEDTNKEYKPGGAELGGVAVSSKVKDPEFAQKVAIAFAEKLAQSGYVKAGRIDSTFSLDGLTSELPMQEMTKKLKENHPQYKVLSTVAHSLPNKKFATGFGELLQKLVAGQSAADFIKAVDALQESSK
ncbi:extracellular solute-binding protein [Paenibacillus psychroresistens]|uniref:Extracellular solute-binding protein n=1 Tax=Paenibacillus psychroresistens TaxID=1778678 RepID=A0A6B8RL04_9BACL|nr:extracellular solute-binding protein [Paenibacillus psychroresistens]QGQ96048.1 extracellular solute-binding protein [Paenibacillus psychroresistens]